MVRPWIRFFRLSLARPLALRNIITTKKEKRKAQSGQKEVW